MGEVFIFFSVSYWFHIAMLCYQCCNIYLNETEVFNEFYESSVAVYHP